MSRKCSVSNKRRKVGNSVSHSNVKVKRAQEVNLRTKKFWLEEKKTDGSNLKFVQKSLKQ